MKKPDVCPYKERIEHNENKWMKAMQSSNSIRQDMYNQLGDLFHLVRQQQAKINKMEDKINALFTREIPNRNPEGN